MCPPAAPSPSFCGLGRGTDKSHELPWQTPFTTLPSSHVEMGSLQCQQAETPASGWGEGCSTAGCTQRDGEAHILQRPHLWAKIAVLWESGRSILAGSLEEVRFRGLYLESRGEQTVCTSGHWAVLTLTRACEAEATWSSDWGTDGKPGGGQCPLRAVQAGSREGLDLSPATHSPGPGLVRLGPRHSGSSSLAQIVAVAAPARWPPLAGCWSSSG